MDAIQPFAFAGLEDAAYKANPWLILEKDYGSQVIPAIADYDTIRWALGKAVGDTIDYTDERGEHFQILLAGAIKKTMLQGSLIISERNFTARFPSAQGYQVFLIDTPPAATGSTAKALTLALRDFGLEVTPAAQRLALFLSVENSYLSIFLLLGGLGLFLGSIGMGVIVMRNVLERRKELALLGALGFKKPALYRLILGEHAGLLGLGLAAGTLSALLALIPNLLSTTAELPLESLAGTLLLILLSGIAWIWFAARLALRGDLLPALRNE
ncbi:MAG: FtsX-like permease family protein [Planctomycetes bacterium ADurb.Bin412]|nr:MAG: FtsX-like permease family protein [Planctomycetes bacterium ADurb.Bin412]